MNKLAGLLAVTGAFALTVPTTPAMATESYEARVTASYASRAALDDMMMVFGTDHLKPGKYLWRDDADEIGGDNRVVISLENQLAFLYRGDTLVAAASISTGREGRESPAGIFHVLLKKPMHHSKKYDNAPMPWMQMITDYGVALHAGANPGHPASHGCIRLPAKFAKKLYGATDVGTTVLIGA
ncbi:MAG TPA: L,D-transpeptidase family protein [Sphingomicrobium sp.]|nr:L,D-transpeptidase family protein [Sphingomicrobium sp.]